MWSSRNRIIVTLAAGTMLAMTAPTVSARSGPNPFERKVLPVLSGATNVPVAQDQTGTHDTRCSDGAAPANITAAEFGVRGGTRPDDAGARASGAALRGRGGTANRPPGPMIDHLAGTASIPRTSLDSNTVMAVPVPLPAGAVQLDSTYYDLQDFGSLGQRIVIGDDGRVHVTWEDDHCDVTGSCPPNPAAPQPYPYRGMGYAYRDAAGAWHDLGRVGDPTIGCTQCVPEYYGGFGTIALTADGRAVIAQHMREDGCDERGDLYVQRTPGAASWMAYLPPIVSPSYLFPQGVVLPNGSMVMIGEVPLSPPAGFYGETNDFKASRLPAEGQRFVCPTGWQMGAWQTIAPSSLFRDGHGAFPSLAVSSNGRVGVAVTDFGGDVYGGNAYLIESSDGTFAAGTVTIRNLTNYSDAAIVKYDSTSTEWRPWVNCHLAYQDTTPHVVWSELQARRDGNGIHHFDWRSRIRHWSSTQGLSTVKQVNPGEADTYDNIDLGLHGPLAGFNTISVDWPQVGFSPGGYETYVVWVRFTDAEIDPTAVLANAGGIQTGTGFGDIACSVLRSGRWSEPQNLTQTPHTDERYVSLATRNEGGKVHIVFQASATDQAGTATVGDRGGENCGPAGCTPLNLVRRIAYLEKRLDSSVVSVDDRPAESAATLVSYPNPARGSVRFSTGLVRAAHDARTILVYSVAGRRVARIPVTGLETAWDGRDDAGRKVASGLYFARFEGDRNAPGTKFMMLH